MMIDRVWLPVVCVASKVRSQARHNSEKAVQSLHITLGYRSTGLRACQRQRASKARDDGGGKCTAA